MNKHGRREYVQVLRLMESFELADLHAAVKQALQLGAIGFDAVEASDPVSGGAPATLGRICQSIPTCEGDGRERPRRKAYIAPSSPNEHGGEAAWTQKAPEILLPPTISKPSKLPTFQREYQEAGPVMRHRGASIMSDTSPGLPSGR